jgi:SH3 domain
VIGSGTLPTSSTRTRSKSDSEKPRSRSVSRAPRIRTNSTATTGEKEKTDKSLKMSVTGWASSAVSSMSGRGKKDTENFVGLMDGAQGADDDDNGEEANSRFASRRSSFKANSMKSTPNGSPSMPARVLRPSLPSSITLSQDTKIVRAMYDFSGSSDELSFKAGDEIVLLHEVVDGWWRGELYGANGLFPITYTEPVVTPQSTKSTSAIPQRLVNWTRSFTGPSSDEDDLSKMTLMRRNDNLTTTSLTSDDDEHPFGDHNHLVSYERSPVYGNFGASIDDADEEGPLSLQSNAHSDDEHGSAYVPSHLTHKPPGKKAPPPPPPRRLPASVNGIPPSLPDRRPRNIRSNSTSAIVKERTIDTAHVEAYSNEYYSPFDSPVRSQFDPEIKRDPFSSRKR